MFLEVLISIGILIFLFYRWAVANNDFFEKRGIAYQKPTFLLGGAKEMILRKKSFFNLFLDLYNESDAKIYGIFEMRVPLIFVKDPLIIKDITIKYFDHFINRRTFIGDDLFGNGLIQLRDSKWRDMRSTLTPIFTGSKMRYMFELMNEVARNTIVYVKQQPNIASANGLELDMKDFATRFINDIIATTIFGLQVNSFENKQNQFYTMGKQLTNFGILQNLKFFLHSNCGSLMKILGVQIFDKKQTTYFKSLVLDAMRHRKEHNISRPDMIQMLMEAQGMIPTEQFKAPVREWSDTEIVAQCFIFFFAGFESSSTLLSFVAHELVENPMVQIKLFEEITAVEAKLAGASLNYDVLQSMKYLDMVIAETLRKWPAATFIERICNKEFLYEQDGLRLDLKPGDIIWMPSLGIQRDAKYFKEPNKFDPERFNDENKQSIQPCTYFPFGLGPRSCIANRFAILKNKVILYHLLRDFRIEATERTAIPLTELSKKTFQLVPENGFWLKFVDRGLFQE